MRQDKKLIWLEELYRSAIFPFDKTQSKEWIWGYISARVTPPGVDLCAECVTAVVRSMGPEIKYPSDWVRILQMGPLTLSMLQLERKKKHKWLVDCIPWSLVYRPVQNELKSNQKVHHERYTSKIFLMSMKTSLCDYVHSSEKVFFFHPNLYSG
jgi:hypothetical protein